MENLLKDYRTISDFLTLIVLPEIENRIKYGLLFITNMPLELSQFQIIWDKSDSTRIVELNDEVQIIVKVVGKRQINAGESLTIDDIYTDK